MAFDRLSDLRAQRPAAHQAWLDGNPLRAMVPRVLPSEPLFAAEIVDSKRGAFTPYTGNGPRWTLLRLQLNMTGLHIVLPNTIRFDAISLEPGPAEGPNLLVHFDTDRGRFTACPPELAANWPGAIPPPDDARLEAAFLGLTGSYTPPEDPPEIAAFSCRHIGLVAADCWGLAETTIDLPLLSNKPLHVEVNCLGPEDAVDIDAALGGFLGQLEAHLQAAAPHVVENMRAFAKAAYRDPDAPPFTGINRDDAFEQALALTDANKIWDHVQPYALRINRKGYPAEPPAVQRVTDGPIYVALLSHCDWEIEHGLGLIWQNGVTLSAVGSGDVRVGDGL